MLRLSTLTNGKNVPNGYGDCNQKDRVILRLCNIEFTQHVLPLLVKPGYLDTKCFFSPFGKNDDSWYSFSDSLSYQFGSTC